MWKSLFIQIAIGVLTMVTKTAVRKGTRMVEASRMPATTTTIAAETVRQEGSLEAAATHLEPRINATEASGSTTAQDNPASGLQVDLGAILRGQ